MMKCVEVKVNGVRASNYRPGRCSRSTDSGRFLSIRVSSKSSDSFDFSMGKSVPDRTSSQTLNFELREEIFPRFPRKISSTSLSSYIFDLSNSPGAGAIMRLCAFPLVINVIMRVAFCAPLLRFYSIRDPRAFSPSSHQIRTISKQLRDKRDILEVEYFLSSNMEQVSAVRRDSLSDRLSTVDIHPSRVQSSLIRGGHGSQDNFSDNSSGNEQNTSTVHRIEESHANSVACKLRAEAHRLYENARMDNIRVAENWVSDSVSFGILFQMIRNDGGRNLRRLRKIVDKWFFGLNESSQAFILILFTDILVGFHSQEGWVAIFQISGRHLGMEPNKYFTDLFVAVVPVVLDVLLKWWVFTYLRKMSPATGVIYEELHKA